MRELLSNLSSLVPQAPAGEPENGGSLRVIVVDDVAEFREATCDLLQVFFDVDVVATGKDGFEALQLAIAFEPDLLIMNANMPGIGGVFAASLVANCCPSTKILIMSEDTSPEIQQMCRSAGAHGITSKSDLASQFAQLCCAS